jgi:predicted nucleotidyltransferase component of viral defense system
VRGKKPKDLAASVRARLMQTARQSGEEFQYVLTRYALERLLYRLSRSNEGKNFVLKGAMLFQLWTGTSHRPTRDLDLLSAGAPAVPRLEEVFRQVCGEQVEEDGLRFLATSIKGEQIKEQDEYQGIRIRGEAKLGNAKIPLQIDIGFGDTITPGPLEIEYPTLLDFPAPKLLAYNRETVIAEKFQAMVNLGMANSRMKDFFDVWSLARTFAFDGQPLSAAIAATFQRRKTDLPAEMPLALSEEFADDRTKQTQ